VKDIYEVLRQKEIDCARVQADIEALRGCHSPARREKTTCPQASAAEEEDNLVSEAKSQRDRGARLLSLGGTEPGFWKRRRKVIGRRAATSRPVRERALHRVRESWPSHTRELSCRCGHKGASVACAG